MIRRSPLRDRFQVTRGTGSESLECSNGSVLLLLSVAEESGHGEEGIDLAVLDECWSLDEAAEAAVRPSMATKPGAQLWCVSTAGTRKSMFWRSKVDAGRTAAGLGVTDSGLCFIEWAASRDVDVTDEGWAVISRDAWMAARL